MITQQQLNEWRALAAAATPGPWVIREYVWPRDGYDGSDIASPSRIISDPDTLPDAANAAFIAAAREAVPALLAEVERLTAELAALRNQADKEAAWDRFASDQMPFYLDYAAETTPDRWDFDRWLELRAQEHGIAPPWLQPTE